MATDKDYKRFVLVWSLWAGSDQYVPKKANFNKIIDYKQSITSYDTLKELNEECVLLEEMYSSTPRPEPVGTRGFYDYSEGRRKWGYIAVDLEKKKILKVMRDGIWGYNIERLKRKGSTEQLTFLDRFFRKSGEVPEDYKWDEGEYDGWLKFRWGDGKNAINYVEPPKPKKEKPEKIDLPEMTSGDIIEEEMDKEIEEEIRKDKCKESWWL